MNRILGTLIFGAVLLGFCRTAIADESYTVTLDTTPLIGHPAGPFYLEFAFTDGSGYGDGNNTMTANSFDFAGGSSLGSPVLFGGASGSLEKGITMTDNSFLSLFYEQFAPGLQLKFTLSFGSNDDTNAIPDGFSLLVLDSSGLPIPTLAPNGNSFLTAALHSTGAQINVYGSDPTGALFVGNPVTIGAPTVTVNSAPEPPSVYLLTGILTVIAVIRRRCATTSA